MKKNKIKKTIIIALGFCLSFLFYSTTYAAISQQMVWETRTTGNDNNGGGFLGGAIVATPAAPTAVNKVGGSSMTANTYYVVITYTDRYGITAISPASSGVVINGTTIRTITITPPAQRSTALSWSYYLSTAAAGPYYAQTGSTGITSWAAKDHTAAYSTAGAQPGGVDYSMQNGAQVAIDNVAITATTAGAASNVITFTGGYTATMADIGNIVNMTGGTNINAGRYQISAWTSTTWTVAGAQNLTDANGAGSALTGNMGGSFASIDAMFTYWVSDNRGWVKATATYNLTNAIAADILSTTKYDSRVTGYTTTRGDNGRPTIATNGNAINGINISVAGWRFENFILDGSAGAGSAGLVGVAVTGTYDKLYNVKIMNFSQGITSTQSSWLDTIEVTGANTTAAIYFSAGVVYLYNSWIHDNTVNGYQGPVSLVENNIFSNNTGATSDGISLSSYPINWIAHNTFYGNGRDGIRFVYPVPTIVGTQIHDNLFASNAGYGLNFTVALLSGHQDVSGVGYNGYYNNTLGTISGGSLSSTDVNITNGDPFVASGSNNFALNNTALRGALLRATGFPGVFPGRLTTGYLDIGAAQHKETGGKVIIKKARAK